MLFYCIYANSPRLSSGVSQILHWSPTLLYVSKNLPDKMDFWAFLCFSLKFSPFFFPQNSTFFYSLYGFWDIFPCSHWQIISSLQWWKQILTSYKVPGHGHWVNLWVRGWGVVRLLTFEVGWGVVRNRESRVFRSPEVGISGIANSKKRCSFISFFLEGFVHFPNTTLHRIG